MGAVPPDPAGEMARAIERIDLTVLEAANLLDSAALEPRGEGESPLPVTGPPE